MALQTRQPHFVSLHCLWLKLWPLPNAINPCHFLPSQIPAFWSKIVLLLLCSVCLHVFHVQIQIFSPHTHSHSFIHKKRIFASIQTFHFLLTTNQQQCPSCQNARWMGQRSPKAPSAPVIVIYRSTSASIVVSERTTDAVAVNTVKSTYTRRCSTRTGHLHEQELPQQLQALALPPPQQT